MDKKMTIKAIVKLILGGCSFFMLVAPVWWVGFVCALVALILSVRSLKSEVKFERMTSLVAILLALGGAVAYVVTLFAGGNWRWLQ